VDLAPRPRPAKKKAKTTKPNKSSTTAGNKKSSIRGKARTMLQQGFQNAPLDVIRDIATHLDLKTLLALTRTCRVTRSLVLDPTSAAIWADIKAREAIPMLSSGVLTDVEFARLVYDKTCHCCAKGQANKLDFTFLIRTCAKCWNKK